MHILLILSNINDIIYSSPLFHEIPVSKPLISIKINISNILNSNLLSLSNITHGCIENRSQSVPELLKILHFVYDFTSPARNM